MDRKQDCLKVLVYMWFPQNIYLKCGEWFELLWQGYFCQHCDYVCTSMFHLMSCLCLDKLASCVNMKETETEYEWIFPPQQPTTKSFSLQNNIIQIHFFSFSKILQWPCYSVSWVGTWICCKIQSANWNILHNFVVLLLGDSLTAIMWRNTTALTKYVFRHICHFYFTIHKGVRVYIQNWKFFYF